jgi:hypothetical protein
MKNEISEWVAYCVDGCREVYRAPNGGFVQAAAEKHSREEGHKVIVGFEVDEDWKPKIVSDSELADQIRRDEKAGA